MTAGGAIANWLHCLENQNARMTVGTLLDGKVVGAIFVVKPAVVFP